MPRPRRQTRGDAAPQQARSLKTRNKLLDAAEKLISERGIADVSITDIVRRARSSVGGFYARFADKDALIRALHDRGYEDAQARLSRIEAMAEDERHDLAALIRASLAELAAVFGARRRLVGAFVAAAVHDPEAWQSSHARRAEMIARLSRVIASRPDEVAHDDPLRAGAIAVHMAFALSDHQAMAGGLDVGGSPLGDAEMVRELERAVLAYLRGG